MMHKNKAIERFPYKKFLVYKYNARIVCWQRKFVTLLRQVLSQVITTLKKPVYTCKCVCCSLIAFWPYRMMHDAKTPQCTSIYATVSDLVQTILALLCAFQHVFCRVNNKDILKYFVGTLFQIFTERYSFKKNIVVCYIFTLYWQKKISLMTMKRRLPINIIFTTMISLVTFKRLINPTFSW